MCLYIQVDDEFIGEYSYVKQFWNIEKKRPLRTAPRLTEHHVYPTGKHKMKVKYASQLLSHSTAAGKTKRCDEIT